MRASLYPPEFFAELQPGSFAAARRILPMLHAAFPFKSLIDVGCGSGEWLKVAQSLGVSDLLGLEGFGAISDLSNIPISIVDLEKPLCCSRRFDLCLCLEVAEHLSVGRSSSVVSELVKLSDIIAFSAAIPLQGGQGHLNEQWPGFWADLFAAHGFHPYGAVRRKIWRDDGIPWWYRQNLILYISGTVWSRFLPGIPFESAEDLAMIHPECFLWNVRGSQGAKSKALVSLRKHYTRPN